MLKGAQKLRSSAPFPKKSCGGGKRRQTRKHVPKKISYVPAEYVSNEQRPPTNVTHAA